jgi:hypothetical protein
MSLNLFTRALSKGVFVMMVLSANVVYAQMGSYSVYDDASIDSDGSSTQTFLGWSSVEDSPPSGCDHTDYYTTTTITSPTRTSPFQSSGMSSNSTLDIQSEEGYWNVETDVVLTCSCAGGLEYGPLSDFFSWDVELRMTGYSNCYNNGPVLTYQQVLCSGTTSATCNDVPFNDPWNAFCSYQISVMFIRYKHGTNPYTCVAPIIVAHDEPTPCT